MFPLKDNAVKIMLLKIIIITKSNFSFLQSFCNKIIKFNQARVHVTIFIITSQFQIFLKLRLTGALALNQYK